METENKAQKKIGIKLPVGVTLISVLLMIIALFLPYLTAVGNMAEYIEKHPDRVEIESLELTAKDLANVPIISASTIMTGVYGEDDGTIAKTIVLILAGFLLLTTLFAIFKKPIAIMIFDLLTCGTFFFFNYLMKEVVISENTYAWGIGYYIFVFATTVVFVSGIWMLVTKIRIKRQAKKAMASNSIE